mmetsp:Transcript_7270/g.13579  ORF Transcript_7270/g.13579 Transcript_7270/m.13579 type:complete len:301 (-) Transcript_7270:376-1278(-)
MLALDSLSFPACEQPRPLADCIFDHAFHMLRLRWHRDGSEIAPLSFARHALVCFIELGHYAFEEFVIYAVLNQESLSRNAVLTTVDERSTNCDIDAMVEICVITNHEGILAAELEDDGSERLRSASHHELADARRPDEQYFIDTGLNERGSRLAVTCDDLDKVWIIASFTDDFTNHVFDPFGTARRILRYFDNCAVSREKRSGHVAQHIVERIVPGNDDADNTQRIPLHTRRLGESQQKRHSPVFWFKAIFSMLYQPSQLFQSCHNLAQGSLGECLSGFLRHFLGDKLLVLKGPVEHVHH